MARPTLGARLRLCGPDARYGARPKKGLAHYIWFIRDGQNEFSTQCRREDRAAAELKLARYIADRAKPSPRAKTTVEQVLIVADALTFYGQARGLKVTSAGTFKSAVKSLTADPIAALPIEEVGEQQLRALNDRLIAGGFKPGSARAWVSIIHRAIGWCHENGRLAVLPPLWLPPQQGSIGQAITRSDAAKLLWACRSLRASDGERNLALFIQIALRTAARRESIMTLRWAPHSDGGHIDLKRNVIDFRRGSGVQTHKRRTAIPIPRTLRVPLRQARARTTEWVFEHGNGQRQKTTFQAFAVVRKRAGLPTLRIHDLSHSATTWLIDAGHSPTRVSAWTGKSMRTILSTYSHVLSGALDDMADTMR